MRCGCLPIERVLRREEAALQKEEEDCCRHERVLYQDGRSRIRCRAMYEQGSVGRFNGKITGEVGKK